MVYVPSGILRTLQSKGGKQNGGKSSTLIELLQIKKWFLAQTITLFIAQLVVTFAVFQMLGNADAFQKWAGKNSLLIFVGCFVLLFVLVIVLAMVPMSIPLKLVLFTLFSVLFGVLISLLKQRIPSEVLKTALIGAIAVFLSMFVLGMLLVGFGINLWWLGGLLFVALLGLIVTGIVFIFIHPSKEAYRIKAAIAIAVFALYIVFDTNQIMQREYWGDFVTAALDYYLDMINVFLNLVQYYVNSE